MITLITPLKIEATTMKVAGLVLDEGTKTARIMIECCAGDVVMSQEQIWVNNGECVGFSSNPDAKSVWALTRTLRVMLPTAYDDLFAALGRETDRMLAAEAWLVSRRLIPEGKVAPTPADTRPDPDLDHDLDKEVF